MKNVYMYGIKISSFLSGAIILCLLHTLLKNLGYLNLLNYLFDQLLAPNGYAEFLVNITIITLFVMGIVWGFAIVYIIVYLNVERKLTNFSQPEQDQLSRQDSESNMENEKDVQVEPVLTISCRSGEEYLHKLSDVLTSRASINMQLNDPTTKVLRIEDCYGEAAYNKAAIEMVTVNDEVPSDERYRSNSLFVFCNNHFWHTDLSIVKNDQQELLEQLMNLQNNSYAINDEEGTVVIMSDHVEAIYLSCKHGSY